MNPFAYSSASSTHDALAASVTGDSRYIAGGTNLVDLMKFGVEKPKRLVDVNSLPFQSIEVFPTGEIHVGALVTNTDLAYHPIIQERYPVLSQAILSGASPQLRNMATVGGNLLQRTRCPYFYDVQFPCNKREPSSGCSAIGGYNRSHAILGTSESCIATHPSDTCVAMAAIGAVVQIASVNQTREVAFADFHKLPKSTPEKENALQPGELITAVVLPNIPYSRRSYYLKVRDRASYEFALAAAAVMLDTNNGRIREARIALGGVGTKPWRATEAETTLIGAEATEANFRRAAHAALNDAQPHRHNTFKLPLARNTLIRALTIVGGMA